MKKETVIEVGHAEARRRQKEGWFGGWTYSHPDSEHLNFFCFARSVSLAELDDFIEKLEAEGAAAGEELRERRQRASEAVSKQNNDAVLRHLEWIMRRKEEIERESFLLPLAQMGNEYSGRQSDSGKRGADARWNKGEARAVLNGVIDRLAQRVDGLGDALDPSELWPELYAEMEAAELSPCEQGAPKSYASQYLDQPLTYDAFRQRIYRARAR